MASEAALVATRFAEARETGILDLASCKLTQIPTSIYIFIKNTPITKCDLSGNQLKQIPAKFFQHCKSATELNLSRNCLQMFPDDILELKSLQSLNLSSNSFSRLPRCLYFLESLRVLTLQDNQIDDVDTELLLGMRSLERVNLEGNPLNPDLRDFFTEQEDAAVVVTL